QVPVGTVLLEEVGFRGALHAMLRRDHGQAAATAVSSALFGLWHILPSVDMARANPALGAAVAGDSGTARVVAGSVRSTAAAGAGCWRRRCSTWRPTRWATSSPASPPGRTRPWGRPPPDADARTGDHRARRPLPARRAAQPRRRRLDAAPAPPGQPARLGPH